MASTKIINVLRTDKFEDILDIFNQASAEEVIFVLPKRGQAFNKENHFAILGVEAKENGKKVSLLCSNPDVNALAVKYGFNTLSTGSEKKPSKKEAVLAEAGADVMAEEDVIAGGKEALLEETAEEDIVPDGAGEIEYKEEVEPEVELEPEAEPEPEAPDEDEHTASPTSEARITNPEMSDDEYFSFLGKPGHSDTGVPADYEVVTAAKMDKTLQDVIKADIKSPKSVRIIRKNEPSATIELDKFVPEVEPDIIPQRIRPTAAEVSSKVKNPSIGLGKKEADLSRVTDKTLNDIKSVWQSQDSKKKITLSPDYSKKRGLVFMDSFAPRLPGFLSSMPKKAVWGLMILAVVLLGAIIFVSTGTAKIVIKPREEKVDFRLSVSASDKLSAVDQEGAKMPGQLFSIDKTISDTFNSTGSKEVAQKARGKISVYNEYGTTPQTLIATTRFEFQGLGTGSGLIFRTLKTIIVPGMRVINGKSAPGVVDVEVIADKAGQIYNVSSGNFGIAAFKEKGDLDRYHKFYAKSSQAMSGGILGKAKVVTDKDYADAKTKMETSLIKQVSESLKSQGANLKVLDENKPEIKPITSTAAVDEAADTFSVTISGNLTTVGFKEQDMYELIAGYLNRTANLDMRQDKLQVSYENIKFNKDSKILAFDAIVKGVAYRKIDDKKLIDDLMGKNESEIKEYIKNMNGIASAKVSLSPFWVRRIPTKKDKVSLEVSY